MQFDAYCSYSVWWLMAYPLGSPRTWEDAFHQDSSSFAVYISDQAHFSVETLGAELVSLLISPLR